MDNFEEKKYSNIENFIKNHYSDIDLNNKINIKIWKFIIKTIFKY